MAEFDTIDERIRKCATGTDTSYGKCVLRTLPLATHETPQMPALLPKYVGKQSGQLVTHDIYGNPIVGGTGLRRGAKKCVPSDKTKPLRPCHVELDVPTAEDQAELGIPGMPVIRLCSSKNHPGALIPVSTPEEALRVVNEFCGCAGPSAKEGVRKKCARSVSHQGTQLHIGGAPGEEEVI